MSREQPSELIIPKITAKDISTWISLFPEGVRKDRETLLHAMLLILIREFLGVEFCERHLMRRLLSQNATKGYIAIDLSSPSQLQIQIQKIHEFAEALMNLQFADGFYDRIKDIKSADDSRVESAFAEFTAASMLYRYEVQFRFVKETGIKTRDYDFDIMLDASCTVCADAKCKLESTEIDTDSVKQSLHDARQQLPENKPGLIFMKVPQTWLDKPLMAAALRDVAGRFMGGTGRIVNVVYLSKKVTFNAHMIYANHSFQENPSQTHRFLKRDYSLFRNRQMPRNQSGGVLNWIRLTDIIDEHLI